MNYSIIVEITNEKGRKEKYITNNHVAAKIYIECIENGLDQYSANEMTEILKPFYNEIDKMSMKEFLNAMHLGEITIQELRNTIERWTKLANIEKNKLDFLTKLCYNISVLRKE